MRIAITATVAAALALFAASMLGVASAEAPSSTTPTTTTTAAPPPPASAPAPSVSVQGVANVPIAQGSNASSATAAYRQGMAGAVSDGQSKAEFLAGKVGATLGAVQHVNEEGGSIECAGEQSNYVEYEGEQPDFGSSRSTVLPEGTVAAPAVAVPRHKVAGKRPKARKAAAATCTLSAQVSLVYAIS